MHDIWAEVQDWMMTGDDRKIEFSHGGRGGKWYAAIHDDDGFVYDGVGDSHDEALAAAWATFLHDAP